MQPQTEEHSAVRGSEPQSGWVTTGRGTRRLWRGRIVAFLVLTLLVPLAILHRFALWLDDWLFPSIRGIPVERPLFIVGLPRSGTTLFHRLIASGRDQFTALPLWELILAPALCEKYCIGVAYRLDQWLSFGGQIGPGERCIRYVLRRFVDSTDAVHPTDLCAPEEDYLALIPFDGCFLRVLLWPYEDSTWALGFFDARISRTRRKRLLTRYRGILQRHLAYRGKGRAVVSKNPGFAAWLPELSNEFPDACFIGLRREPRDALASQLSSLRAGLQLFGYCVTDELIVHHFLHLLAHYWKMLDGAQARMRPDRFCLIAYSDLMENAERTVRSSLERFGYALSREDDIRLHGQVEAIKDYRSRHRYCLSEFGLNVSQIEAAFFSGDTNITDASLPSSAAHTTPYPVWTYHGCNQIQEQSEAISNTSLHSSGGR